MKPGDASCRRVMSASITDCDSLPLNTFTDEMYLEQGF